MGRGLTQILADKENKAEQTGKLDFKKAVPVLVSVLSLLPSFVSSASIRVYPRLNF